MKEIFDAVNGVFHFVVPIADFLWDFPTNFGWYAAIPVLGKLSFAVVLLIGSGIFFSIKTGFIQITHFKEGLRILTRQRAAAIGISPLAAFFLSSAMRVGPGNILGVTGAISVGGPGALFWMWVSAFFGMSTAFMEATLAQIFKEKKGDEFVGGLPFYGKKIMGNRAWVGVALSAIFILYAMFCLPAQAFNVFSSVGSIAEVVTGNTYDRTSVLYYIIAVVLIVGTTVFAFGGIKKITKVTDKVVPIMAVIYCLTVIVIAVLNFRTIPFFFGAVFKGAFTPEAIFGGFFGTALVQGVKRGLMSNEAGQGTITMSAAASNAEHPCEQGCVQALGVFLDTIIICTLSGFIVVMAQLWNNPAQWEGLHSQKLPLYLASITSLTPGIGADSIITLLISLCYGLFAYTCVVGFIIFSEIAANRISQKKSFINFIRILGALVFIPFGALSVLAGLELDNLWYISDLGNIIIVYCNLPILFVGAKYAFRATNHYKTKKGEPFTSEVVGITCEYWDERANNLGRKS
ncbi:amino-acid carrier protein AlsT [Anaerotignum neopropionicum]|uniref:Amino-acid carrier protein AlsT n=1 Tax=Anaerotignum neopropionicum TaxID=36847 RepID=A0A136WID0_9FIRM|nr:amino acid carrier protein [Anaerotignum neopropionicum]KXL54109.1 amino-acid carrier protein AlsT [Anaerotignum neopropionicum]